MALTFRQITYMVLDELKISSDDSYYTEEHIAFLANRYRAFLLERKYRDIKKYIPESNYQTICIDLEEETNDYCDGDTYLKSTTNIPQSIPVSGTPRLYTDYFLGEITYVSRDRLRYVGNNRWLKNFIYWTKDPEGQIVLKSSNPQFKYLTQVKITDIFEDVEEAALLSCDQDEVNCELMDKTFPIESALVPPLIELIVQELKTPTYSPEDTTNDANDNLQEVLSN